jgi:hypothetical protein
VIGTSLNFITLYLRTYLTQESPEHLASSLRRAGVSELLGFFPAGQKRTSTELANHFNANGLSSVVEFYQRQRSGQLKEETLARLKELVSGDDGEGGASNEEILEYLKTQEKEGGISEADFVALVWEGLVSVIDMGSRPDQIGDLVMKELKVLLP